MLTPLPSLRLELSLSAQQQALFTQLLSDNSTLMKGQRMASTHKQDRFLTPLLGAVRAGQPLSYSDRRWQDLRAFPHRTPYGGLDTTGGALRGCTENPGPHILSGSGYWGQAAAESKKAAVGIIVTTWRIWMLFDEETIFHQASSIQRVRPFIGTLCIHIIVSLQW